MILVAAFSLSLHANAATSADGFWSDADAGRVAAQLGPRSGAPTNPRTVYLDLDGLKASLANAPALRAASSGVPVYLPMPDGSFELFEAFEAQIMEKELQERMPEGRNYVIQGVKDRTTSGRINFTASGLYAIVLRAGETVYVETWGRGTIDTYVTFHRKDFYRELKTNPFKCGVKGSDVPGPLHKKIGAVNRGLTAGLYGSQLKTFRIAIAATTEFTADQGGAGNALNSITNTVTALTAIYERELAVNFILVGNNANIVYTGADPYTNGNLSLMIDENQINLDNPATIGGTGAYDIGHVFGFVGGGGGGGLASTGSVCSATRKGTGGSQGSTGAGQAFLVDLVAHEIGHQHDANHTFNGSTGSCAGNRTAAAAWEPASGTTLMSYAGICGAENIQNNQDQYFHTGSLEQMNDWIRVDATGSSCGTQTATGNTPPSSQGLAQAYTIPTSTPFTLTGMSNDINGDQVTHTWEQFDVGTASPPSTDDGTRPIFRSFPGTVSTSRDMPKTFDILTNTTSFGESLPTTNRTMNFRMTVRDNRAGGGGAGWTTSQVTSTTTAGPFSVTSFNAGGGVASGAATNITWNVANTDQAPVGCTQMDILLSTDGGATFGTVLADDTANDGTQTVTMPGIVNTQARVKVQCSNNIFFDINDTDFGIGATLTSFCDTPGLALPVFGNVNDTLNVGGGGNILDVNISVDASMATFADAGHFTVSHLGTDVRLLDGLASCQGSNIDAVFDDEAAAAPGSVCAGNPAINGAIQPVGTLGNYDATDQGGVWNLNYQGQVSCGGGCSGTLNEWCVITAVALGGGGNNPPVLAAIGPQNVMVGNMLNIPLSAMDQDVGDVITLTQMNVPGFCVFNDAGGGNGSINCTPGMGDDGTYMITVIATDNGAPALQDDETFTLTVTPADGTITQCVTPNTAIPFNGTDPTVSDIVLAQTDLIGDINVSLRAPHTWIGDLQVQLTHVDTGQSALIIDRPGEPLLSVDGCSADNIDVILDDEGAAPAEDACATTPPAMGGMLTPNNLLSAFDDEAATGTWRLTITDVFLAEDNGVLEEWCVIITPGMGGADTDADGVPDSTDNCTNHPNPNQTDSNGDGFGNACDADLNGDCVVNPTDLGIFRLAFLGTGPDEDFNGDGLVNPTDLGILRLLFLQPPGPNATGTCP